MVLPHLWETDPRQDPLFTIILLSTGGGVADDDDETTTKTTRYGFFLFSITYWLELLLYVTLMCTIAAITAIILYQQILQPRQEMNDIQQQQQQQQRKKPTTATTTTLRELILVYGILLPFWIIMPSYVVYYLNLRNLIFKFVIGVVTPILTVFRMTEALHGFCPPSVTQSLWEYVIYFATPMTLQHDSSTGKPIKATVGYMFQSIMKFMTLLLICGTYQSFLIQFPDWSVFSKYEYKKDSVDWFSFQRIISPAQWGSTFFHAGLFQMYLYTFGQGLMAFSSVVTHYEMVPIMGNAIFTATSPSDFWGRKWNRVVHTALKQGVYKPIRSYSGSSFAGTFSAFIASGVLHEWLLSIIGVVLPHQLGDGGEVDCGDSKCFQGVYGAAMCFFLWQALFVAGEGLIHYYCPSFMPWMGSVIPRPFLTATVIIMGIPLAHWFTEPYIHSDYYLHGTFGLPMWLPV